MMLTAEQIDNWVDYFETIGRGVPVSPNDTMLTAGMESDSIAHPWQALDVYRRMIATYNIKETK